MVARLYAQTDRVSSTEELVSSALENPVLIGMGSSPGYHGWLSRGMVTFAPPGRRWTER